MKHVNTSLPDFIRGTLPDGERRVVEDHVRHCVACKSELDELTRVFAAMEDLPEPLVPPTYFASLLPRIHQRMDERAERSWFVSPLVQKLVLPFAAAIVVAVLMVHIHIPGGSNGVQDQLLAVVDSAAAEDIGEIVRENIPAQDLSAFNTMVISHALSDNRLTRREIVREALGSESTSPFEVFANVTPQQLLSDLDDAQTDEILQKLGHMETL